MATINWSKWIKHVEQIEAERSYKDRIAQALDVAQALDDIQKCRPWGYEGSVINFEGIAKIYNVREQDLKDAYDKRTTDPIHFNMYLYDAINRDAEEILKTYGVPNDIINPNIGGISNDINKSNNIMDNIKEAYTYSYGCSNEVPNYKSACYEGGKRSGKTQKRKWFEELKDKLEEEQLTDRYKVLAIKMGQKLKSGKIFRKLIRKKTPIYSTKYTHIQRQFERLNSL